MKWWVGEMCLDNVSSYQNVATRSFCLSVPTLYIYNILLTFCVFLNVDNITSILSCTISNTPQYHKGLHFFEFTSHASRQRRWKQNFWIFSPSERSVFSDLHSSERKAKRKSFVPQTPAYVWTQIIKESKGAHPSSWPHKPILPTASYLWVCIKSPWGSVVVFCSSPWWDARFFTCTCLTSHPAQAFIFIAATCPLRVEFPTG